MIFKQKGEDNVKFKFVVSGLHNQVLSMPEESTWFHFLLLYFPNAHY